MAEKLLIATRNPGKVAEYAEILSDLGYRLVSLKDVGITSEVAETGNTYAENALLKARRYATASGLITLADDSGLEVDALAGAPGVYSARYAGPEASDEERYRKLLAQLEGVPDSQRTARFRCVIAIVWPDGREVVVEGTCEGCIAHQPRGNYGFGYDPIFYLPKLGKTMAEIPPKVKNQISHRAQAARRAREWLSQGAH